MKLLMVVNVDWFFLSHRLPVAKAALDAGWDVHVATSITRSAEELEDHGFSVHEVDMHRSSWNPLGMLKTLVTYIRLYRSLRPDVVHLVTIKPVLLGGIAARLSRVSSVVFAVSGLGHVFVAGGVVGRLRRTLVRSMYRLAMGHPNKAVIFQNTEDEAELVALGCVREEEIVRLPGSGFDVDNYQVSELPAGAPVFLMASRLIRTKGVMEFIAAAELLQHQGVSAEFWLVGGADPLNPEGLTVEEVEELKGNTSVKVLGHCDDVPELMRSVWVVVLPSYYGEGLPKVLIEAAAAGRAVITTDTPGCRDAIEDKVTGILVAQRDADSLSRAMATLAQDRVLAARFGERGRERAEALFRVQDVASNHLEIYSRLRDQAAVASA